ncbi:MAG: hypothetical protein EPN93_02985 [Spirochaetes bacterium]|nr:MAG: hypothetical protein EPN93_02985 [Spirochaetota bacterium]
MKKAVVVVLALSSMLLLSTALNSQGGAFGDLIDEVGKTINGWKWQSNLSLALTVLVAVLGVVIVGFQRLEYKWVKSAVIIMGILIPSLVVVKNTCFDTDYKAIDKLVREMNRDYSQMKLYVAEYNTTTIVKRKAVLEYLIFQKRDSIYTREDEFIRKISAGIAANEATTTGLLTSAYAADDAAPEWVSKTPADDQFAYFVGIGRGNSIDEARRASMENGIAQMRTRLALAIGTEGNKSGFQVDAASLALESKQKIDEYLEIGEDGTYTCYTMLNISRRIITSNELMFKN